MYSRTVGLCCYPNEFQGDKRLGDSKLIYDPSKGRFFEKEIEEICRDEYCARDEKTGEPIILSVVEKERIFLDCIQSYYYNGRCVKDGHHVPRQCCAQCYVPMFKERTREKGRECRISPVG